MTELWTCQDIKGIGPRTSTCKFDRNYLDIKSNGKRKDFECKLLTKHSFCRALAYWEYFVSGLKRCKRELEESCDKKKKRA